MAAIFGQCPLCPAKTRKQRLYPTYCQYHTRNQGKPKEKKQTLNEAVEKLNDDAYKRNRDSPFSL